jgi:CBS domain-containing protein
MSQHHVKRVPVIDGHRLVGVVSESDVASSAPQDLVVDLGKGVYASS